MTHQEFIGDLSDRHLLAHSCGQRECSSKHAATSAWQQACGDELEHGRSEHAASTAASMRRRAREPAACDGERHMADGA